MIKQDMFNKVEHVQKQVENSIQIMPPEKKQLIRPLKCE